MRRTTTISLLLLLFAACVSAAEPISPAANYAYNTTSTSLSTGSAPSFDARSAGSHFPTIYMPYTPGQRIPHGWRLMTIKVPVKEVPARVSLPWVVPREGADGEEEAAALVAI